MYIYQNLINKPWASQQNTCILSLARQADLPHLSNCQWSCWRRPWRSCTFQALAASPHRSQLVPIPSAVCQAMLWRLLPVTSTIYNYYSSKNRQSFDFSLWKITKNNSFSSLLSNNMKVITVTSRIFTHFWRYALLFNYAF